MVFDHLKFIPNSFIISHYMMAMLILWSLPLPGTLTSHATSLVGVFYLIIIMISIIIKDPLLPFLVLFLFQQPRGANGRGAPGLHETIGNTLFFL